MRAGWMRPSCEQLLERHAGDLAAHAVEAGQDDRVRRVVDDEVDAGEVLERADVAALAADDAALHVVGRQLDDARPSSPPRGAAASRCIATERIERTRRSASRFVCSSIWRRSLDALVADLVLDLLDQHGLGLRGGQARTSARARARRARGSRRSRPRARRPRARGGRARTRASRATARGRAGAPPAGRPRPCGRGLLVGLGGSRRRRCLGSARCGREPWRALGQYPRRDHQAGREAQRHHDRRDHDFHCVSSPRGRAALDLARCSVTSQAADRIEPGTSGGVLAGRRPRPPLQVAATCAGGSGMPGALAGWGA